MSLSITAVSFGIRRFRVVTAAAEAAMSARMVCLLGGPEDGLVEDLGRGRFGMPIHGSPWKGPLYGLWRSKRARPSDLSRISVVLMPAS